MQYLPGKEEYASFYAGYIAMVGASPVMEVLQAQPGQLAAFIAGIPEHKAGYAYAPGKWTIAAVLGHMLDTERIMAYRALRLARRDTTPLPGFDEQSYAAHAPYHGRSLESLCREFALIREGNLCLAAGFGEEDLLQRGTASGHTVSVRALLYIMAGHVQHHMEVLAVRYR